METGTTPNNVSLGYKAGLKNWFENIAFVLLKPEKKQSPNVSF